MTINVSIRQFIGYFEQQARLINSLVGDESIAVGATDPAVRTSLHKKVLYSAVLDSLARVRYHQEIREARIGNKIRFLRLLREHGDWRYGHLVSVPILAERLGGDINSELRRLVTERLARYRTDRGNALPLTAFDAPLLEIPEVATDDERRIVEATTHFNLFYHYRNFLVHEFRKPGYAMEAFADGGTDACYHSYLGADAKWALLYPEGFFRARVERTLATLERYWAEAHINPYDHVTDTSSWLDG